MAYEDLECICYRFQRKPSAEDPMGIMANRSVLQLLLSSAVLLCNISAQQIFLEQQLDQLPAPDLGGNDVLPEMLLTTLKKTSDIIDTSSEIPVDTLIDPDGRIVAFSRRHAEELQEERELLERIAKKTVKNWFHGILVYGRQSLHLLLSFAVGSLVGDVFLHLLPAVWADTEVDRLIAGIWTTAGVLFCFMLEKLCSTSESSQRKICAVLNLIANFMDNFTHGLAVGGSFLMDAKLGLLTTFSIVIHELPHEVSDFAILLRADFDRWSAVKAQLLTAVGGALGACAALFLHIECATNGASQNILPFTAGGFINIALAQILPELMKETDSSGCVFGWYYADGCTESISS
ncbi:Zinc transporter ZIP13 [Dirofilaria immitis]|nr:Zinc transporter ZIP13 [Dirofilaria immitis]